MQHDLIVQIATQIREESHRVDLAHRVFHASQRRCHQRQDQQNAFLAERQRRNALIDLFLHFQHWISQRRGRLRELIVVGSVLAALHALLQRSDALLQRGQSLADLAFIAVQIEVDAAIRRGLRGAHASHSLEKRLETQRVVRVALFLADVPHAQHFYA